MEEGMGQVKSQLMAYFGHFYVLERQGRVFLLKFKKTQTSNRESPKVWGLQASAKGNLEGILWGWCRCLGWGRMNQ